MKNLAIKVVDRLFIVAYGPEAPTDQEWADYLRLVERQGIERTMQIVATEGGEPAAVQRRELVTLLGGRVVPVAVLTGSARVRATVTALSWCYRWIRAFPATSAGLGDALAYLGSNGLLAEEARAANRLGWMLLGFVVVVVSLGGWLLMLALEHGQ
jgi:hypothetical protein